MPPSATTIRLATTADADGCRAIYGPIVEHRTTSFETAIPTEPDIAQRIATGTHTWPWLVAVGRDEAVKGYAYVSQHRGRAAYQWSAEVSVYIDPNHHRSGLGRRLYEALFACLRAQGFYNAYAGVTLPNDASVGLHRSMNFVEVGVYENVGFKFGAWHSVRWLQKRLLTEGDRTPTPPRALASCRAEIEALLAGGYQGNSAPE